MMRALDHTGLVREGHVIATGLAGRVLGEALPLERVSVKRQRAA